VKAIFFEILLSIGIFLLLFEPCSAKSDSLFFRMDSVSVVIITNEDGVIIQTNQRKFCNSHCKHVISLDKMGRLETIEYFDTLCDVRNAPMMGALISNQGINDTVPCLTYELKFYETGPNSIVKLQQWSGKNLMEIAAKNYESQKKNGKSSKDESDFIGSMRLYYDKLTMFRLTYEGSRVTSFSEQIQPSQKLHGIQLLFYKNGIRRLTFFKDGEQHMLKLIFNKRGRLKYLLLMDERKNVFRLHL
jgi:hypothetical protein